MASARTSTAPKGRGRGTGRGRGKALVKNPGNASETAAMEPVGGMGDNVEPKTGKMVGVVTDDSVAY